MIEGRQRVIDRIPERRMMVLATDGALRQFRPVDNALFISGQPLRHDYLEGVTGRRGAIGAARIEWRSISGIATSS